MSRQRLQLRKWNTFTVWLLEKVCLLASWRSRQEEGKSLAVLTWGAWQKYLLSTQTDQCQGPTLHISRMNWSGVWVLSKPSHDSESRAASHWAEGTGYLRVWISQMFRRLRTCSCLPQGFASYPVTPSGGKWRERRVIVSHSSRMYEPSCVWAS